MGAEQFQPGQGDDRPSRTVTCEDARRAEDCGKVSRLCWCDAAEMGDQLAAPDAKKEEFRKYLAQSGVIDALTKVLVGLYEEPDKPSQAIEFIKMQLGAPGTVDVEALKSENEQLKAKVDELQKELESTKAQLAELAPPE